MFFNAHTRTFTQPFNNSPAKRYYKKINVELPARSLLALDSQLSAKLFLSCLWTFRTILGTTLCAISNTGGIKSTTHDVIAHTGKVFHTTATNEHNTVLLKVVAFSRDIGVHFLLVGQTNTGNLTHCRIRLFRSSGVDTNTDATTLRTVVQCGRLALVHQFLSALSY